MPTLLEREIERAAWYTDPARRAQIAADRKRTRALHERMGLIKPADMAAVGALGGKAFKAKYGMKGVTRLGGEARGKQLHEASKRVRMEQTRKARIAWKRRAAKRRRIRARARRKGT